MRYGKVLCALGLSCALVACGGDGSSSSTTAASQDTQGTTSGPAFDPVDEVSVPTFDESGAIRENDGSIDISSVNEGVVMAHALSPSRLKFIVSCGDMTYNYDLPGDDTSITCPINMGSGTYYFAIMRNTSGSNYVETASATANVTLETEFAPFTRPNIYCNYTDTSACVEFARGLVADAENEGDAVRAVCTYICDHVTYDLDKAASLSGTSGYVPNPDETFVTNKGICFDYASLGAAMLRSVGIPTKIITGYVSPEDLYHAWIMVFIDGSWSSAQFAVNPQSWSRVDLTFAADSGTVGLVGDGKTYTERYVY